MNLEYELLISATILPLLVYLWMGIRVAQARVKYNVPAPAITGNPDFERVFRVQQNTLEQLVLFLPSLWLFQSLIGGIWGGLIGLVWPVGRIIFALGYYQSAEKRHLGFTLTLIPTIVLLFGAITGLVILAVRGH